MKTFTQIKEDSGVLVDNIVDPASIRNIRTLARQLSAAFQSTVPDVLNKIEVELNKFGYTLGELDADIPYDATGDEDFFIICIATKEIVKNLYVSVTWETLASGQQYDLRPEGSALKLSVAVTVSEVTPAEMAALISNQAEGDELLPDTYNGDLDMEEGVEVIDESFRIKKINRNLEIVLTEEKVDFIVNTDGSLVLEVYAPGTSADSPATAHIPRNKALQVMNALMDHFVAFQK